VQRVHIVGAGGIGCAVGYALRAGNVDVLFVDSNEQKVQWGNANGVGVEGQGNLPAPFTSFDDWDPGRDAIVVLCTKCYCNAAVLARLPATVTIIPIQNGFDLELEARCHGLEGIASFVSECDPARPVARITRPGKLFFGSRSNGNSRGEAPIADRLRRTDLFSFTPVEDILPYKYAKLMYNAAISPLAAAAGIDNGELLRYPRIRRLFFRLLAENYAILRGAGVPMGKIGPFHPSTVARILRIRPMASLLAWAFYPTLRGTYCSMSNDLPAGRTEIENYNGHLIRLAAGRPCPLNTQVHALVKRMERERIPPSLDVLDEIV
jgi:2-dehydropantoate 2-reductase